MSQYQAGDKVAIMTELFMVFITFLPEKLWKGKLTGKFVRIKLEKILIYLLDLHLLPATLFQNGERSEETSNPDRNFSFFSPSSKIIQYMHTGCSLFSVHFYRPSFQYSLLVLRYITHKLKISLCPN
jgi:hypothetical protein